MLDAYLWLNYDKPSMMININYNNIFNLALNWFYVYLFDSLNSNVCAWIRYWLNKILIIYLLLIFINQRKFEYERQPMWVCVCVVARMRNGSLCHFWQNRGMTSCTLDVWLLVPYSDHIKHYIIIDELT